MKFPDLVPNWVCTIPITLQFCNWQDGGQAVYTADQKIIEIKGRAYFNGDICPTLSNIVGGTAEVFGETREIHQGFKRRNPDGTVNHTEIQFK